MWESKTNGSAFHSATSAVISLDHCLSRNFLLLKKLYIYIYIHTHTYTYIGFPGGSVVKNPPANAGDAGDTGSTPGSGRYPGEGNGNPLQYSCLGNPMDRGTWWFTIHGVTKESDTT